MSTPAPDRRVRVRVVGGYLAIPCCINIREIDGAELDALIAAATDRVGAAFFRTRDLFDEVLADRRANAANPSKFLSGPFLSLYIRLDKSVGVSTCDATKGGDTVYAPDQFIALTRELSPESVDDAIDAFYDAKGPRVPYPRPHASDWVTIGENGLQYSKEEDTFWFKGRAYDERSAIHNGLIGPGARLRAIVSTERDQGNDEGPSL